jgi:alpha-galactosidase
VQVAAGGEPLVVSHFVGWQVSVPVGTVRWINGLRGDAPDTPVDDAFSVSKQDLAPGESVTLAAYRRSSERFMPFVMIDNGSDEWFGGVQWSGTWRITCARGESALQVTLEYPDTETTIDDDGSLEMPHSFFGVAEGGPAAVSGALRGFLTTGVREGRPVRPLVTYNTWYPYGSRIDEPSMLDEIDRTASIGMELFVLDAGWYQGAGALGFSDFDTGLGTWAVDSERFPNGLRPLADRAHANGMKFGLWVEPGRVSLDTVGLDGLAHENWLAQYNGRNVTPTSGQLCFGSRAAREWVQQQLYALIDAVQPDYLKWDNNAWINCNRMGHSHGADDGNFVQVRGLYAIWQALRERYPDLLIENVADGGSRIDFGSLRYADSAWMDDRTTPSVHVRHNLEGLSALFPPGYLLSFVVDDSTAPLALSSDPIAELRSRMAGVLGFAYRSPGLLPRINDAIAQSITDYRQFHDILQNADAILLSEQAPATAPAWDVLEEVNPSTGEAVLFAYQQADANDRVLLRPRGLRPDATYAVRSVDAGDLGTARGDDLMRDGIEVVQGDGTQAHILILRVQ